MNIPGLHFGTNTPPFIIAEMSGNHNQSLQRALEIVTAAAATGVQAIKLQTYTADTMTINVRKGSFNIADEQSLWAGKNLYDLYKEAHTPWEWHKEIFDYARSLGLVCFSTPFDETAVEFLEKLDAPLYKIASFENTHHPLLKIIAQTGKPVIMSTGACSLGDLYDSVNVLRKNGCNNLVLLKCTSTYPASPENSNLLTIPHMRALFGCEVGLSDHTLGIGVSVASVALGATVIEKHFTLSRAEGGVDSAFSMEPAEMKMLAEECLRAWQSLGRIQYDIQKAEEKSLMYKRSIYAVQDIKKGDALTTENIRVIRPGDGLPPKYFEQVLTQKATTDIATGTPLSWSLIH